jgi:hypothetical protein
MAEQSSNFKKEKKEKKARNRIWLRIFWMKIKRYFSSRLSARLLLLRYWHCDMKFGKWKKNTTAGLPPPPQLTPVILVTMAAEIRRILVWNQTKQILHETLSLKYWAKTTHTHTHTHTHTKLQEQQKI